MKPIFDSTLHDILNERLARLEVHFNADVIFYYGPIADSLEKPFRDFTQLVQYFVCPVIEFTWIIPPPLGKLTQAELLMLREQDLAMLRRHEQARDLTVAEELKNSTDSTFQEVRQLIDEMKELGLDEKPGYTLPLADTIGRAYYTSLNRHQPAK